jgi:hypothetical protein
MKPDEIRQVTRSFIALCTDEEYAEPETALPLLLDQLALAQHAAPSVFDLGEHPDPPGHDDLALRQRIGARFPNYGYYNAPASMTVGEQIANTDLVIGDAIDDLLDITKELLDIEWRWSHVSENNALHHFQATYRWHWEEHLRNLQLYLTMLRVEAIHKKPTSKSPANLLRRSWAKLRHFMGAAR